MTSPNTLNQTSTPSNHAGLRPDQASEILRLMSNSQHPKLQDAAREAEEWGEMAKEINIGSKGLDAFFADCAYFGINTNSGHTARRHDAESGKKKMIELGLYNESNGHLNVAAIAQVAALAERSIAH